ARRPVLVDLLAPRAMLRERECLRTAAGTLCAPVRTTMRPSRQVSVMIIVVAVLWSGAKGRADQQWTLTLFLTPECARNEEAVRAVRGFLHRHREISGKGVLSSTLSNQAA